ncbi:MAG: hypothetical protein GWO81_06915 [Verrucomicrobia bacterium]|nr:hypothetical protein [Verrucomicrobiota bacterium]
MVHFKLPLFVFLATATAASAYDFDFTSSEGFTSPGAVALNGQKGWTATSGILANTDAGKEFLFLGGTGQSATNSESFDPNAGTMTMTADFRFNANPTANSDIFNIFKLYDTSGAGGDISRVYFRYGTANDDYRIRYSTGNGFDRDLLNTNVFTKAQIGLDDNNTTDDLRLTWTFTKGADAASWGTTISLYNITTSTDIDLSYVAGNTYENNSTTVTTAFHGYDSVESGFVTTNLSSGNILSYSTTVVPEASTYALIFGSVMLGYVMIRRRKA